METGRDAISTAKSGRYYDGNSRVRPVHPLHQGASSIRHLRETDHTRALISQIRVINCTHACFRDSNNLRLEI